MPLEQRAICDRCQTDCGGTTEGKHFYTLSDAHGHKKLLCILCADEWSSMFKVWMDQGTARVEIDIQRIENDVVDRLKPDNYNHGPVECERCGSTDVHVDRIADQLVCVPCQQRMISEISP